MFTNIETLKDFNVNDRLNNDFDRDDFSVFIRSGNVRRL